MITIGIRELKTKLSRYIRLVRAGETILITSRGEVVAELRQPDAVNGSTNNLALNAMIREGTARLGSSERADELYEIDIQHSLPPGRALELLHESRGEG